MTDWHVEEIPDSDSLFYRVHETYLNGEKKIPPAAFRLRGGGMSTDWSRYSSAERQRLRATVPEENGVVTLPAGEVREHPALVVVHTPRQDNRAHADVMGIPLKGAEKTAVRLYLRDVALAAGGWTIHPNAPVASAAGEGE